MAGVLHKSIGFVDKRQCSRHDSQMKGEVKLGSTKIADCILKNTSFGGARLVFPTGCWIPSEFILGLPDGLPALNVRKIWQENDCAGVKFETRVTLNKFE